MSQTNSRSRCWSDSGAAVAVGPGRRELLRSSRWGSTRSLDVIEIDVNVGAVTVNAAEPLMVPDVAVIVLFPAPQPWPARR